MTKAEKRQNEEQKEHAFSEILEYVEGQVGISYYDVKAYAYANDLHDWISVLNTRNDRAIIASYIRSKRKSEGVPYSHSLKESRRNAAGACDAYKKRRMEEYERNADAMEERK